MAAGAAMVIGGLMIPAHLRAVDDTVLERAARNTPTLIGQGLALAYEKKLGAAQMLSEAAQLKRISGREKLAGAVAALSEQSPELKRQGLIESSAIGSLFQTTNATPSESEPVTTFVIQSETREAALGLLNHSSSLAVLELMRFRDATNTVLFPPSSSASGQAIDAAIGICGLLLEGNHLTTSFSNAVTSLAISANLNGKTEPLEQVLMDLMSLGQRFNWGQLVAFVGSIDDPETLRQQVKLVRKAEAQLPILFSAVQISSDPKAVAKYLMKFDQTGLADLGASLRYGVGGVNELLRRNQRLHISRFQPLLADWCLRAAWVALTVKWILYLFGGFLLAMAMHLAWPRPAALERPLQVRGIHVAREFLFGLGFLLVVLLLSEPFLAQESQRADLPLRLRVPTVGSAAPAGTPASQVTFMNPEVLITMSIFFVLQALLYIMCLVKLAEIRRQKVPPRIKLRLLENEDHLFDSGLYLGFLGTIVSFVLTSLHVFQHLNLMAAYSATSFGILFVVLFKVVHLRPARRKLLMEAEAAGTVEPSAPTHPFTAPL
jgi:hypothetical protein